MSRLSKRPPQREYVPLRVVTQKERRSPDDKARIDAIIAIMHANSRLVGAGKDSAMPHYIACVKYLEEYYGFTFEKLNNDTNP